MLKMIKFSTMLIIACVSASQNESGFGSSGSFPSLVSSQTQHESQYSTTQKKMPESKFKFPAHLVTPGADKFRKSRSIESAASISEVLSPETEQYPESGLGYPFMLKNETFPNAKCSDDAESVIDLKEFRTATRGRSRSPSRSPVPPAEEVS